MTKVRMSKSRRTTNEPGRDQVIGLVQYATHERDTVLFNGICYSSPPACTVYHKEPPIRSCSSQLPFQLWICSQDVFSLSTSNPPVVGVPMGSQLVSATAIKRVMTVMS